MERAYRASAQIDWACLAEQIHVPRTRMERLCSEDTSMTVDTAMRLSWAYGISVDATWL